MKAFYFFFHSHLVINKIYPYYFKLQYYFLMSIDFKLNIKIA